MESSGGGIRKLKSDKQPLFRGESSGFVDLPLSRHVNTLTSPDYS